MNLFHAGTPQPDSAAAALSGPEERTAGACRICGNRAGNGVVIAREMLIGTRTEFAYLECAACGCLQIAEIPSGLDQYYPQGYYSFRDARREEDGGKLWTYLRRKRDAWLLFREGFAGRLLQALRPADLPFELLGRTDAAGDTRVLDVGCGSGSFLRRLRELGMERVQGIDPFIPGDIEYAGGIRVLKKRIDQLDPEHAGPFDVILFNHSFEHMPDPAAVLKAAKKLLSGDGRIIIHIPTVSSYAWQHYREHWVQLDAPRHLYLYSVPSFGILAAGAGFSVDAVVYSSQALQFWGSELYRRDIPLALSEGPSARFSAREMRRFAAEARALNRSNLGDQAAFYLKRT